MGTGRKFHKQPVTRPKKKPADVRRRQKVQKKRLMDMGVSEEVLRRMTTKKIRTLLKRPLKTAALIAESKPL